MNLKHEMSYLISKRTFPQHSIQILIPALDIIFVVRCYHRSWLVLEGTQNRELALDLETSMGWKSDHFAIDINLGKPKLKKTGVKTRGILRKPCGQLGKTCDNLENFKKRKKNETNFHSAIFCMNETDRSLIYKKPIRAPTFSRGYFHC